MKNNIQTRHHIVPQSRGGRRLEDNIALIPCRDHRLYHQLFENRTPEEIGIYLQEYFWANKYSVSVFKNDRERYRTK